MLFKTLSKDKLIEHKRHTAFHEAGHATAIYLNNREKRLPPVTFQIVIKELNGNQGKALVANQAAHESCSARVEGGRLIDLLSISESLLHKASGPDEVMVHLVKDYMAAFELDIVNLLVGPLAEARYVADMDNELFNPKLVHLKSLHNYGGSSDIALVNEYMHSFYTCKEQQDKKLGELFLVAFNFVNNKANWAAITKLANFILESNVNIISYEKVSELLD